MFRSCLTTADLHMILKMVAHQRDEVLNISLPYLLAGLTLTTFAPTPRMSAYLLALAAGHLQGESTVIQLPR
jgi:hypothetical protein